MFEHYYSFFHYCLLSCRYVMLQKSILRNQNGRHKQLLGGHSPPGPPPPGSDGTEYKSTFEWKKTDGKSSRQKANA